MKIFKTVNDWFAKKKPEAIFFAVALVGGIYANKTYPVDFLSNGFKPRNTGGIENGSGNSFVYMAFAEAPFVNSNGVPCNSR